MRRILLILCTFTLVFSMTACSSSGGVSQEEYDELLAELEELKSGQETEEDNEEENIDTDVIDKEITDTTSESSVQNEGTVEITAEYTLVDSSGRHTRHFIVITNNSNETVSVSSSSIAYDAEKNILGAADASFDALGAGCTSVMFETFDIEGTVADYDTTISSNPPSYYESVIQDLTYTQSDISSGAVFQVTNEGSDVAEFVKGYALFIKDGILVDYDYTYFTDDDNEIKPGATVTKQLDTRVEFDSIQFYLDGRK